MKSESGVLRVGLHFLSKNLTIVVVPRTWFGPKIKEFHVLQSTDVIALPDKGERIIHFDSESSDYELLKKGFRTQLSTTDDKKEVRQWYTSSTISSQYKPSSDDEKITNDHKNYVALLQFIWHKNYNLRKSISQIKLGGKSEPYILGRTLIEHIKRNMRELKRTYKQQIIKSSSVNGQIDFGLSAPNISANIPILTCRVDDFSITSIHYSALMTAIESLSKFKPDHNESSSSNSGKQYYESLSNDSKNLRARFREIPSLSLNSAINVLSSQRLPAQLQKWKEIFHYAHLLLTKNAGNDSLKTVQLFHPIQIESFVIWEDILEQILLKNNVDVVTKKKLKNPWVNSQAHSKYHESKESSKEPDLVFVRKGFEFILDAKYYLREDEKRNLDLEKSHRAVMSNGYQMMAYALCPNVNGEVLPRIILMAFPSSEEEVNPNPSALFKLLSPLLNQTQDEESRSPWTPVLQTLGVPFPTADDILRQDFDTYATIGEKLLESIDDLIDKIAPVSQSEEIRIPLTAQRRWLECV